MSAYLCEDHHFGFLVACLRWLDTPLASEVRFRKTDGNPDGRLRFYLDQADDVQRLAAMLWRENVRSLKYRYPSGWPEMIGATLDGEKVGDDADPADLEPPAWPEYHDVQQVTHGNAAAAVMCYEYQSCEHPGWTDSMAHELCDKVRGLIVARVQTRNLWGAPEPNANVRRLI